MSFRREKPSESLCDTAPVELLSPNLADSTSNDLKSNSDINIITILIIIVNKNNKKTLSCSENDF